MEATTVLAKDKREHHPNFPIQMWKKSAATLLRFLFDKDFIKSTPNSIMGNKESKQFPITYEDASKRGKIESPFVFLKIYIYHVFANVFLILI